MIRDDMGIRFFIITVLSILGIVTCLPLAGENGVLAAMVVIQAAVFLIAFGAFIDLFSKRYNPSGKD